jgi:hypothetical protein
MKLTTFDYSWPNNVWNNNRSKIKHKSFSYTNILSHHFCFSILESYVYDYSKVIANTSSGVSNLFSS